MFALITPAEGQSYDGFVRELFDTDPGLPEEYDVRDVSKVKGIAEGWIIQGGKFSAPPPPVVDIPMPLSVSKLGLKRALAETGDQAVFPEPEWPAVKALLGSSDDLQEDWDLAIEVRPNDPLVEGVIAARKYTPEQVKALMLRARDMVG